MESKARRTPRLTAPAEVPAPYALPEASVAIRVDKPMEDESFAVPDVVVQRILPPAPLPAPPSLAPPPAADIGPAAGIGDDIADSIAQSRAALTRGFESISDELASFARHSIDSTARAAIQMLAAKTWADAVAVNTGYARTSFDSWLDSTARVSELGVRLAAASSKPFMAKIGEAWSAAQWGRRSGV
jgi:hypothetical protein